MAVPQLCAFALVCVWFGMVAAISFLEAPLKFRAPGITRQLGGGIGRIVFAALNRVEVLLAVGLSMSVVLWRRFDGDVATGTVMAAVAPIVFLALQLVWVRPVLRKESDKLLSGEKPVQPDSADKPAAAPRGKMHYAYVVLELLKVVSLVVAGFAIASLAG